MKRERKASDKSGTNKKSKLKENKAFYRQAAHAESVSLNVRIAALLIILAATFVAYYPALDNELTNWDDKQYVKENPYLKSLDGETIKAIFSEKSYMGNYHPLTMLSLNIDYMLGGENEEGEINPFSFHLTNVLLHLLVTLLVFQFAYKLSGRFLVAFIAGLLFGTHTIHVESVAWVSERKDVLYSVFFVGSLSAYLNYIDRRKNAYYALSILLFLLSLLSKGQAVSLAVSLLAIDFYRERRLLSKQVIVEKIPFFALALGFGLLAVYAQAEGDAIISGEAYGFHKRIGFAGYAFTQYLMKMILPVNLSAMYPYPDIINKTMPAYYWLGLIPSALVVWFFFKSLKKNKAFAFSIAFFLINIFLLLQLLPVGSAVHADRYAYIPSIGFFMFLGFAAQHLIDKKNINKTIIYGITGVYIVLLIVLTMQRCEIWQDSMSLWNDTVAKQPKAVTAWNNRGSEHDRMAKNAKEAGNVELARNLRLKAINDFSTAIEGKPDYSHAMYNRGSARYEIGKNDKDTILLKKALQDFSDAITYDSRFAEAYHNRGNVKAELGDYKAKKQQRKDTWQAAMKDFNIAIDLKPEDGSFYVNRGVTKGKLGKLKAAVADFNKALKYGSENESVYSNRGLAKARIASSYKNSAKNEDGSYLYYPDVRKEGTRDSLSNVYYLQALKDYNKSLELKPEFLTGYYNRGIAYFNLQEYDKALSDFNFVLKNNPNFTDAWHMRGLIYLNTNKLEKACADFTQAQHLGHRMAGVYLSNYCK